MMSGAETIVVAMSGGVDSSTVAAMLHEQGHNVIGVTLQLYDQAEAAGKKGACCAGQDIYDAKMVADRLGINHYVLDYESKFSEDVIDDFADSYLRGETPLPCVRCNQSVKFRDLLQIAKDLGATRLATGHYIQKVAAEDGKAQIHCGFDSQKDQSYFLFATTDEQLEFLDFPIGGMTKDETRKLAQKYGLEVADKPDSQDICFVPTGNYREFINKLRPESNNAGDIWHIDGYKLGEHSGIINYTIGQRRGIGIGGTKEPLYVVKIDPAKNIVYVGGQQHLSKPTFTIKEVNWLARDIKPQNLQAQVKIRSTMQPVAATVNMLDGNRMQVSLIGHEKAVSPGQACVVYLGKRLLGGGWIERDA